MQVSYSHSDPLRLFCHVCYSSLIYPDKATFSLKEEKATLVCPGTVLLFKNRLGGER
jgi:RNase P subunit RPR2